ncbi:MAG TPA: hypothetical protein VH105_12595 [Burkholderiales bacterium]|jgi:hypothetical protein|nr:hypothetical protein [Burkholderiales bacterium]
MNLNEFLEINPDPGSPLDDEGLTSEEFQLAVAVLETGMFTGDFPPELLNGLLRMVPGANPAV